MRMFALSEAQSLEHFGAYAALAERFAAETGEMSAEQLRDAAASGYVQLWGLQDADGVRMLAGTEVAETPAGRKCTIRIAATDDDVPVPLQERLLDEIGKWAQSMGCNRVAIVGREGWRRRFPRFKQTGVVLEWQL